MNIYTCRVWNDWYLSMVNYASSGDFDALQSLCRLRAGFSVRGCVHIEGLALKSLAGGREKPECRRQIVLDLKRGRSAGGTHSTAHEYSRPRRCREEPDVDVLAVLNKKGTVPKRRACWYPRRGNTKSVTSPAHLVQNATIPSPHLSLLNPEHLRKCRWIWLGTSLIHLWQHGWSTHSTDNFPTSSGHPS